MTTKLFFGLYFLAITNLGLPFTPNPLIHIFVSSKSDDATHASITEAGIKRAVRDYFLEKNPGATPPPKKDGDEYQWTPLDLLYPNPEPDYGLIDIFRIQYGPACQLDLVQYQSAIQQITSANAATDDDPTTKHRADFHFDAEKFNDSNANVIKMRELAKKALVENNLSEARAAFGRALHILQDFYSHSNWVELGQKEPSQGLGSEKGFGFPVAEPTTRTCFPCPDVQDCAHNLAIADKLTSGYCRSSLPDGRVETDGEGKNVLKPRTVGKCSHGGFLDKSANDDPIGGINKDTGDPNDSPHWYLHKKAAELAESATAEFVTAFRKDVGDEKFVEFLGLRQPQCHSDRRRRSADINSNQTKSEQKITLYSMPDVPASHGHIIHDQFMYRHPVVISTVVSEFTTSPLTIPIDSTVQDFVIKVSNPNQAESESEMLIFLTSPTNVTHAFNATLASGSVYLQVQTPEFGVWKLTMGASNRYSVTVLGISTWDAIVNVMTMDERGRHASRPVLRPIRPDEAVITDSMLYVYVMAPIEGAYVTNFDLRTIDGILIKQVPGRDHVEQDGFSRHLFQVTVPSQRFRIVVRAQDANGYDVERASETVFDPMAVDASADVDVSVSTEPTESTTPPVTQESETNPTKGPAHQDRPLLSFSMDNSGFSVLSLALLIVLLWLVAILVLILFKVSIDRCRGQKSHSECQSGV